MSILEDEIFMCVTPCKMDPLYTAGQCMCVCILPCASSYSKVLEPHYEGYYSIFITIKSSPRLRMKRRQRNVEIFPFESTLPCRCQMQRQRRFFCHLFQYTYNSLPKATPYPYNKFPLKNNQCTPPLLYALNCLWEISGA